MPFVRSNLRQRLQHKFSLVHLHMGDAQVFFLNGDIVIENDIQIQCPRSPVNNALTSLLRLDPVQLT